MQVGVTPEETAVLIRWKKRSDNHVLVRMKAEAILYASRGVDVGIIAKMVEGRVSKFYDTACLLEQQYVKDDDLKVGKYVENTAKALGGEIKVVSFVSYERGEGLEKREDDFAAEIDKLVNGK